jgi:RNA polymerase sigma factor (sigma-70 family)
MSPLSLRRYRAERLLRDEFDALRATVLASVRGRLRAAGASLDDRDLEACYAQAWQGLYMATLEGQEIDNPAGWLVVVTFRRALEEHRGSVRVHRGGAHAAQRCCAERDRALPETDTASAAENDLAEQLDDRMRLRQLFEALRGRLDGREREAATLCYLQGLSRAEAAAQMDVSQARMRKLMEGRGPGRPGVAGKVGTLVRTIRDDRWCEEQGSLMRAFAYGILDPAGERQRLALLHVRQCPACRAYVGSLRGLAAVLPPAFVPLGLGAGILARAGAGAHAAGASAAAGTKAAISAGGGAGTGLQAGPGVAGATSAYGAAGAAGAGGAAGGSWLIGAGSLGGKLALGCVLALGLGAGCAALERGDRAPAPPRRRHLASAPTHPVSARFSTGGSVAAFAADDRELARGQVSVAAGTALAPSTRARREFGPEQALASAASGSLASAGERAPSARAASVNSKPTDTLSDSARAERRTPRTAGAGAQEAALASASGASTAAEREFSPG